MSEKEGKEICSDYLTDFHQMQEKWDAVLKSGALNKVNRTPVRSPDYSFMSDATEELSKTINDSDYWHAIYALSRNDDSEGELIQEVRKLYPPNPTISFSYGKDQDPVITPKWIDGDDLNKLNRMKVELHELGDKLATLNSKKGEIVTQGKEPGDDIFEKIKKLRDQIDDLSDSLAPGKQQDTQS